MGTFANSEDPDEMPHAAALSSGSTLFAKTKMIFRERNTFFYLEIITCDPSIYTIDYPELIVSKKNPLVQKGVNVLSVSKINIDSVIRTVRSV